MEVQNQALTLHLREDRIKGGIVDNAGARVGRDTGRVALDTGDAALLGLDNGLGGDRLVQVEGHEVVDVGLNGLQTLLVVEGMVDGRDGRDQVGLLRAKCYIAAPIHSCSFCLLLRQLLSYHDKDRVHTTLPDGRSHQLHHRAIT